MDHDNNALITIDHPIQKILGLKIFAWTSFHLICTAKLWSKYFVVWTHGLFVKQNFYSKLFHSCRLIFGPYVSEKSLVLSNCLGPEIRQRKSAGRRGSNPLTIGSKLTDHLAMKMTFDLNEIS